MYEYEFEIRICQVWWSRRNGGRGVRGCGAAGPGAHRGTERAQLPARRGPRGHVDQGELRGLDRAGRGGLCRRGGQAALRADQAARAGHARALRARPRCRRRPVSVRSHCFLPLPAASEAEERFHFQAFLTWVKMA